MLQQRRNLRSEPEDGAEKKISQTGTGTAMEARNSQIKERKKNVEIHSCPQTKSKFRKKIQNLGMINSNF